MTRVSALFNLLRSAKRVLVKAARSIAGTDSIAGTAAFVAVATTVVHIIRWKRRAVETTELIRTFEQLDGPGM